MLIVVVAILSFLLALGMIAVNAGVMVAARTSVQRAADAGALAACRELPNTAAANTVAIDYATVRNGSAGSAGLEQGNAATTSATMTTLTNDTIQVTVTRSQAVVGLNGLGVGPFSIQATATCRRDEGFLPALMTLGAGTLEVNSGTLDLGETGLVVNSSSTGALDIDSGSSVTGRWIDTASGSASISGTVNPPVTQGTYPDLFAGVTASPVPATPGGADRSILVCQYNDATHLPYPLTTATPDYPHRCYARTNVTLPAGEYWGGMDFGEGIGGAPITVTLQPGIYYLIARGLRVRPGVTVQGSGVTFVNLPDPQANDAPDQPCGPIRLEAGSRFEVTPPAAGQPLAGMLILQGPGCAASIDHQFSTSVIGTPTGTPGVIYLPTGDVNINGPLTSHAAIIARDIEVEGAVVFDVQIPSGTIRNGRLHLVE